MPDFILQPENLKRDLDSSLRERPYLVRHLCEIYEKDEHVLEVKDRQLNRELNLSTNDDHKEEIRKHIAHNTEQRSKLVPRRQENSRIHFEREISHAHIDGLGVICADYGTDSFTSFYPASVVGESTSVLIEHIYSLRLGSRDMPVNIKESYARLVVQALKDDAKLETWDGTGTRDTAPDVNRAIPYGYVVVSSFSSGATTADTTRGYRLTERREVLVSHVLRNVRKPWVEGPI